MYELTREFGTNDPILRYQDGRALPPENHPRVSGFHRIHESFGFLKIAVDTSIYQAIVSHVGELKLPALARETGGFGGVTYGLLIKRAMTRIEYQWFRDPPKEWKSGLRPVIAALQDIVRTGQNGGEGPGFPPI